MGSIPCACLDPCLAQQNPYQTKRLIRLNINARQRRILCLYISAL